MLDTNNKGINLSLNNKSEIINESKSMDEINSQINVQINDSKSIKLNINSDILKVYYKFKFVCLLFSIYSNNNIISIGDYWNVFIHY